MTPMATSNLCTLSLLARPIRIALRGLTSALQPGRHHDPPVRRRLQALAAGVTISCLRNLRTRRRRGQPRTTVEVDGRTRPRYQRAVTEDNGPKIPPAGEVQHHQEAADRSRCDHPGPPLIAVGEAEQAATDDERNGSSNGRIARDH